jgi:hypothetical protein
MKAFLIGFCAFLAFVSLAALVMPTGERVALHTVDEQGRGYESTLWVVELPGSGLYLRSGNPASGWLARLERHPLVELERDEETAHYRAVAVREDGARRAVNEAMARKYGAIDRLVCRFVDVERSVPVRLEPIEGLGHAAGR